MHKRECWMTKTLSIFHTTFSAYNSITYRLEVSDLSTALSCVMSCHQYAIESDPIMRYGLILSASVYSQLHLKVMFFELVPGEIFWEISFPIFFLVWDQTVWEGVTLSRYNALAKCILWSRKVLFFFLIPAEQVRGHRKCMIKIEMGTATLRAQL